jgi:hypothetical protein
MTETQQTVWDCIVSVGSLLERNGWEKDELGQRGMSDRTCCHHHKQLLILVEDSELQGYFGSQHDHHKRNWGKLVCGSLVDDFAGFDCSLDWAGETE